MMAAQRCNYSCLMDAHVASAKLKVRGVNSQCYALYCQLGGAQAQIRGKSLKKEADDPIEIRWAHLSLLVEFALDLKKALQSINEQSFNHFVLKMGINHGPITAGVIGARKPHYDIWGNSVNVASRMESTGKAGCIQVTQETSEILQHFGYKFEQRGLVAVKGKGQLMTYYLIGRQTSQLCMEPKMETLKEEDEEELEGETEETQVHLSLADSEKEALLADKPPEPNEETT